eukprot:g27270.t1
MLHHEQLRLTRLTHTNHRQRSLLAKHARKYDRDNGFDSCDIRHLRKLKYYFQAAAINQLGIAEWSNAVMVDMPPRSVTPSKAGAFSGAKAKGAATQKALSAEELRERGNAFFRDGAHSKAVRAYDEAIRAGPSDARCWANRAAAQMAMLAEFGKGLSPAALRTNPYYTNSLDDLTLG